MDKEEVTLTVKKQDIPADILFYEDKVYGKRVFVRNGTEYEEKTKPLVNPILVHKPREYVMHDSASFIAVVSQYGDREKGIVLYTGNIGANDTVVTMFFEEDSRSEFVKLPLKNSLELRSFLGTGKEKGFAQKDFLKLIDTFPENISNLGTLRPMVERIQLTTEIDFESNLDTDNLTFIYKEKSGGNQTGRLPKKLSLSLPFYEGSSNSVAIEVDLEVTVPKEDGAKPTFKLSNVKHERTEREALTAEIATLSSALSGWMFVNGK